MFVADEFLYCAPVSTRGIAQCSRKHLPKQSLPRIDFPPLACLGCFVFWGLAAEAAPDAGSVLQQIQQNIKAQPSGSDSQTATRLTPGQPKSGAVTVRVERIDFQGNTLLSTDQLNAVVAPWVQRDLDYAELRKITAVVSAAYREAGWMASVSLPRQEIRDGLIQLQIVEAKFGKTVVQGDQKRVSPSGWRLMSRKRKRQVKLFHPSASTAHCCCSTRCRASKSRVILSRAVKPASQI